MNIKGHIAGLRHLAAVAEQSEAGYVRAGMDRKVLCDLFGVLVEPGHDARDLLDIVRSRDAAANCCIDQPDADLLGKNQYVARLRPEIFPDLVRMNKS